MKSVSAFLTVPLRFALLLHPRGAFLPCSKRRFGRKGGAAMARLQTRSRNSADSLDKNSQCTQVIEEATPTALHVLHMSTPSRISIRPAFEPNARNERHRLAGCGHRRTATRARKACVRRLAGSGNSPVTDRWSRGEHDARSPAHDREVRKPIFENQVEMRRRRITTRRMVIPPCAGRWGRARRWN